MNSIVEATSLSAVTELAANPPQHPNTSAPPGTQPLVLYIARVPGSRDVFLTPIKPREKVVTASDVQSSLYYVHVNCAEDYDQSSDLPPTIRPSSVNTDVTNLLPVPERPKKVPPPLPQRTSQRKPLPYPVDDAPPYPIDNGPPMVQARPPSPRQRTQHVARKPVVSNANNPFPSSQPGLNLPILPPRPLPTPPAEERSSSESSLHEDNVRILRRSSHTDEHENPYSRSYPSHPETLKQADLDSRPAPGSLTLIRRDPGSNDQWNVATIHDPPAQESSSSSLMVPTASRRTNKGGAPLYLDITNPGYAQFIDSHRSEFRISTSSSASDTSQEPPPDGTFRRRLYMPGSRYVEYDSGGHRKHFSLSSASGEEAMRRSMRGERHSVDMGPVNGFSTVEPRSKGYTFNSPWEGICEFVTGVTGKSLKCRHRFSNGALGSGTSVVEVSELRFNLPTSSRKARPALEGKQSSYFQNHRHLLSSHSRQQSEQGDFDDGGTTPSIMVDEDGRIDLSLGQERAGGGFGGKQAKLGKLIIDPEGVKMLDLLVAANLGLWWRAWERL